MLKDSFFSILLACALFLTGCTKKKEPDFSLHDPTSPGNQGISQKQEEDPGKNPPPRVLPEWQKKEIQELASMRKSFQGASRISLIPSCLASFDGKNILFGGSYSAPWGNCRSFLLISRDGGKTWKDSRVWVAGSSVVHIQWFDSIHGWFITGKAFGGIGAPYCVFSTRDGGKNWKRSVQGLPEKGGLFWPTQFVFASPEKGTIAFLKESREWLAYQTEDGGRNWHLKEKKEIKLEVSWGDFRLKDPYKKMYKIAAKSSEINLLKFDKTSKKWQPLSTLPLRFQIRGDRLVAEKGGRELHWTR